MNENTALLIMVHGSPRPASNGDMFKVVERIRARNLYPIVEVVSWNSTNPIFPARLRRVSKKAPNVLIAVPYFLHSGTHVADDLPGLLEDAALRYENVEFLMGDYLGHDEKIADVVRERAGQVLAEV